MKLLAIDTITLACSVALQLGDDVLERHVEEPRAHTRILIPMIRELLDQSGADVDSLDALVLGIGPGSFIGMRIGASVAQGMAHGAGLNIVPVSSLAAVAAGCLRLGMARHGNVAVAQDARMKQVYMGLFGRGADGLPVPLEQESLVGADRFRLPEAASGQWCAAGEGWLRYPELASANSACIDQGPGLLLPRAADLVPLGAAALERGQDVPPETLELAYLRRQVATPPAS